MRARRLAAFAAVLATAGPLPMATAQVTVPQPRCQLLAVELQSLLDDVEVRPGDLNDPPYVYRAWNRSPHVVLKDGVAIGRLRIVDRALVDQPSAADAEAWAIELMPAMPVTVDLRLDSGSGRFDFTGMRVQDLALLASFTDVEIDFGSPNPSVLESARLAVQWGELRLRGFLNANVRSAVLRLPRTKAEIDFLGRPAAGETEIQIQGPPQSLRLTLPHGLPLQVEGPAAVTRAFASAGLSPRGGALATAGFDAAPFRLRLRFDAEIKEIVVRWSAAVELPAGPRPAAGATPPPVAAPGSDADADRAVARVLEALESGSLSDAQVTFRMLQQRHAQDARIPVLEKWLQAVIMAPDAAGPGSPWAANSLLRNGLKFYLLGEYSYALAAFQEARRIPTAASEAEAWIRKTQSEIERLHLPAPVAAAPAQIIEKIVTQTTSPVFLLRAPVATASRVRAGAIEIAGQVGDDTGIDRIEVSLNGAALLDPSGVKLQVRPPDAQAARKMPFTIRVPLQEGENEIVVTAHDSDAEPHWTSEHLRVTRMPPLYRTPFFAALGAALVLLLIAVPLVARAVKSRIAFVNKYNPYVAGLPIRDTEMLFGRERLLRSVLNTVHNNSIMLYGPRRIGKTSLQLELKRRLSESHDPEYRFVPVFVDLQGTAEDQFFAHVMGDILEHCKHAPGNLPPQPDGRAPYGSREFTRDLRQVLSVLQAGTEKRLRMVLLLDEVDELNKYSEQTNQKLRSVFMKTFGESLVAVMSGTHIEKRWRSEGSPWYNFFEEIEVRPLERPDAIRLIRGPVRGIFSYDDKAIDSILTYSGCRPYLIQRFCVHAINRIIDAKRRRVRAEDVETVRLQAVGLAEEAPETVGGAR